MNKVLTGVVIGLGSAVALKVCVKGAYLIGYCKGIVETTKELKKLNIVSVEEES